MLAVTRFGRQFFGFGDARVAVEFRPFGHIRHETGRVRTGKFFAPHRHFGGDGVAVRLPAKELCARAHHRTGFLVVDFKIIGAQVGAAFELLRVFFLKFDIHFGRQRIGNVHFARFVTRYVVGLRTDGQKHHFIDFHIGRIAVLRFFPARRARLPPIFFIA